MTSPRSTKAYVSMTIKRVVLCIALAFPFHVHGQVANADTTAIETTTTDKNFDFKVMPFFNYNRNLKFMFGAVPMAMYRLNPADTISPKSLSGIAGAYTTNKSYFISFFSRIFLKEDRWRITVYGVTGDNNSQFYMEGSVDPGFYDFQTKTTIVSAGFQRRVIPHFYLGMSYTYSNYFTEYEDNVRPDERTITNGLEFNALYDTRNSFYYPSTGFKARLRWQTIPEWFANDISVDRIIAAYNQYFPSRDDRDVIAARLSGTFGFGEVAFQQQVTVGGKDIRGYTQGKFRGDGLMAVQAEYRFNFHPKWGLVGFVGLATIYGSDTPSFDWGLYPGGGAGFRYKAFDDVNFNIGLDAAVGKDDWGIYFRIGEAF